MDPTQWNENFSSVLMNRVQIYKLDGNTWRELTKDFVLLHMYYDLQDEETKLVAADGVKVFFVNYGKSHVGCFTLIVKEFVLSSNLQITRPTKKFVHFVSTPGGKSEMYGFGFCEVSDVDQFLNQFRIVYKNLHQLSTSTFECGLFRQNLSISSSKSFSSVTSTPRKGTQAVPLFSLENSPWRVPVPKSDSSGGDVQHAESELHNLSCIWDTPLTALNLIPSLSRQSSAGATFNLQSAKSMSNEVVYYETDEPVLYDPNVNHIAGPTASGRQHQLFDEQPFTSPEEKASQSIPDLTKSNQIDWGDTLLKPMRQPSEK